MRRPPARFSSGRKIHDWRWPVHRADDPRCDPHPEKAIARRTCVRWPEFWWSSRSPCFSTLWSTGRVAGRGADGRSLRLSRRQRHDRRAQRTASFGFRGRWTRMSGDRPARSRSAAGPAADPGDGNRPRLGEPRGSPMLENADPVTFLLVGSRQAPAGRPPEMSVFNVFFDTPADRPFQSLPMPARAEARSRRPARAAARPSRSATSRSGRSRASCG